RFAGLLAGYVRLRRLVAGAEPLARPLPLGTRRAIRLVASDAVDVPVAVGLGAATIVLPRTLVATLGDDELDQVLVHELAHLARRDDLTNLIERIVGAILFFHPAVHLVSRRLDLEREIACDDWVVAATGSRGRYASCLTRVAELALGASRHAAPALGLFASRGVLRKRVEHLLDASANALPRRTRFAVVAVAVLAAVAAGIGALRLPVIATPLATPKPRVSTPAQSPKIPHPLPLHAQVAHKPQPAHHPRPAPSEVPPSFVRRQMMVVRPEVSRVVAQMAQVRTDIGVNVPIRMIAVEDVAQVDATVAPAPVPMVRSSRETLRNADFRGKDLRGHNFVAYVLIDPDFTGADLRGAHFDGASLRNPKFAGARLGGATFVRSSITGCACGGVDFSGSQFVGANLHASDFSGASLARASLIGTNFMNVKVGNADFSGANLTGANFVGTDLTGANLRGANLEGINVVGAHLPR
ncbi:MAG: pentapeptide repeat-containing protein, partial [Candidatus Eremiobacteraeota bacterium]|nr:pentapeptide repeat-containing protein [Candidatus Eremiobacteraeota bacterium]